MTNPCEECEHIDKPIEWCNEHCENEKVLAMSRVFHRWSVLEELEDGE